MATLKGTRKTLIAFFSRADENYFGGAMRYVKVGNTEIVVGLMKDLFDEVSRSHREAQVPHELRTEVASFKIEMKDPYSPVYMTCIEEAKKDLRAKARPELVCFVNKHSSESEGKFPTFGLGIPNYPKET